MKKQNGITLIALIITIIVMLILVGVTVNVALNGGLFDTAKQAVSQMNMAQIEEKAYMTRIDLMAKMESKDDIIITTQDFKNRLAVELEGEVQGNKVKVAGGKYDIIVKNTDLDFEVVEHNDYIDKYSILKQEYVVNNIEAEGRVVEASVDIKLEKLINMTKNEYIALRQQQTIDKVQNTPIDEKRAEVVKDFVDSNAIYAGDKTIDDIVVSALKNEFAPLNYDTIEEWIADDTVKTYAETNLGIPKEDLSKGHFYSFMFLGDDSGSEVTEEYVVTTLYAEIVTPSSTELGKEYDNANGKLEIQIKKDEEMYKKIYIDTVSSDIDASFEVYENGTYEVSVGNYTSPSNPTRVEILNEKIVVNSLKQLSDISGAISKGDANGVWDINSDGVARYIGTEETVSTYPTYIGAIKVTNVTFRSNKNIKNVTIPNSVTSIGKYAFEGCTNLKRIEIPNSVTSIDQYAFLDCTKLEDVTISNSTTSIGNSAFSGCTNLKSIEIPNSVNTLGISAFSGCTSLTDVTIPGTVSTIQAETFSGCTSLTNVTLSEGVTTIGKKVFKNCTSLESITLPNSVTSLTYSVVTEYANPLDPTSQNVYAYYSDAFEGCTNLVNIYFAAGDNEIPSRQPYGAPNTNVTVTKLTE